MAQPDANAVVNKLEGQIDEILSLYDFGETLNNYEGLHGERTLNEDQRRQNMVSYMSSRGPNANVVKGTAAFGFAALYLFSRRGAASPMDLSKLRACAWTSTSVFLIGTTVGSMFNMQMEKTRMEAQALNATTATRVAQNEQTHALLRSMKFHLNTRQMSLWDQNAR